MDELAKDLNNALEETPHNRTSCKIKGKSWKSFPKSKCANVSLGSSVPKSSAVSDDSDSSSDNHHHQLMNFSTNGSHHQSDSDEVISKINQFSNYHLTSWRHCSTNMGESDSLNENFHSSREPRRKRKFKRMSIDPPSVVDHEFQSVSGVPLFSKKSKRLRNLKSQKLSKLSSKSPKLTKLAVSQFSVEMENICRNFASAAAFCGKRKRCAYERNFDCNGSDCKGFPHGRLYKDEIYDSSNSCHHMEYDGGVRCHEISSSGLSSSDSECGILTNDESREADDEQSDFFHESGPSYGVPSFTTWWQSEELMNDSDISESNFDTLLSKSFQNMRESTKQLCGVPVNTHKAARQIRSGRRRLESGIAPVTLKSEEKLPSFNFPFKKDFTSFPVSGDNCMAKTTILNEKKRRKRMPPVTNAIHTPDDLTIPLPESGIGFRMLKNTVWKPGTMCGLGPVVGEISSPVKSTMGKFGNCLKKSDKNNSVSTVSQHLSQVPPPPPPSPQLLFDRTGSHYI